MILYIAWMLIFSSIFISIFYVSIYSSVKDTRSEEIALNQKPGITILMPAFNEENVVKKALNSIEQLDYPVKAIFIDDASTDNTLQEAEEFASEKIEILKHSTNKGKAAALNTGLSHTDTEYFVVQDADSKIDTKLLEKAVATIHKNDDLGAVIASIAPLDTSNFVKKLQKVEYRLTNFYRLLMTEINTLNVTPGAFSIYRTRDVKKAGRFDEDNLTEDLEMAFKLREYGKSFEMIYFNQSETEFPSSLMALYNQRVRWARGFIYNGWKYRKMFFNRQYGYFGTLQLPMLVLMPLLIVTSLGMVSYGISLTLYNVILRLSVTGLYLPELGFSELYVSFLGLNMMIYGPMFLSLLLIAYIISLAYSYSGEKPKYILALVFYFFMYFLLQSVFWVAAVLKEVLRIEKVWT